MDPSLFFDEAAQRKLKAPMVTLLHATASDEAVRR
jgi:hypothetical protein